MKIVSYLLHDSAGECWVWRRALKVLCQPNVKALNNLVRAPFSKDSAIGTLFCVICKISFETSILNVKTIAFQAKLSSTWPLGFRCIK